MGRGTGSCLALTLCVLAGNSWCTPMWVGGWEEVEECGRECVLGEEGVDALFLV